MAHEYFSLDRKRKLFRYLDRTYEALYGLLCPFSHEPVIVIGKRKGAGGIPEKGFPGQKEILREDPFFSVVFQKYGERTAFVKGAQTVVVFYYFGRQLDQLLEDAYTRCGETLKFQAFKKRVLAGKHPLVSVGFEFATGRDAIIAVKEA